VFEQLLLRDRIRPALKRGVFEIARPVFLLLSHRAAAPQAQHYYHFDASPSVVLPLILRQEHGWWLAVIDDEIERPVGIGEPMTS
jgi:hypothetical protein